ncbi:MAG TPA: DUF1329 domain-containing protein [Candidatus Binataceae bacterium]|nr:DUF1329 domain-containing protein [Candidatus Binataceae bacterium]
MVRRAIVLAVVAMAVVAEFSIFVTPASAQVKPGDFITPENASRVKDLVAPGLYWRVTHGMTMKIVPTGTIEWPPPYKEATEQYSSQVRLTADRQSPEGYVAGLPFPFIDANDPDVAVKIAWNMTFRPMWTDDLDARFFGCQSVYVRPGHRYSRIIDLSEIGHYRTYNEIGRTEVEPLPIDPDFKQTGRMFLTGLYPLLMPENLRGLGLTRFHYADPNRGDDTWLWMPGARRVRRVNEDGLTSATGVNQFNSDEYAGFNAKNENYHWKFLGEKKMLGALHVTRVPGYPCPSDGGASSCPAQWELRRVYILEATPNRERVPEELYSRHILYVDAEAYAVLTQDLYDRGGQLFMNYTDWLTYRDRPVPNARVAIYPFKRLFIVNASSTDLETGFSTFCSLPMPNAPERECWYINMGAVGKSMCSVRAMVAAAP